MTLHDTAIARLDGTPSTLGEITGRRPALVVNGAGRHPLYDVLVEVADEKGHTGDITWNFEKFLLDAEGRVVARWNPSVEPDDPRITKAVESVLS